MSRYTVDKVLWDVYRDKETAEAFSAAPEAFLADRDLSPDERSALANRDTRWLLTAGAHPFLIYNFCLRLAGGFSIPFAIQYVKQLDGLSVPDITT